MNIQVQAINFTIKKELLQFIEDKVNKLEQYYENIINANVYLKLENTSKPDNKTVELLLEVPGDDIMAKKTFSTFEESIQEVIEAVKKQLIKRKEKEKL